jgi:hypothetical protein
MRQPAHGPEEAFTAAPGAERRPLLLLIPLRLGLQALNPEYFALLRVRIYPCGHGRAVCRRALTPSTCCRFRRASAPLAAGPTPHTTSSARKVVANRCLDNVFSTLLSTRWPWCLCCAGCSGRRRRPSLPRSPHHTARRAARPTLTRALFSSHDWDFDIFSSHLP